MTAETDLERVRGLVDAALASLEASRSRIDDLNVYPVPDGDTGTNLTLTVRAVADALGASRAAAGACELPAQGALHADDAVALQRRLRDDLRDRLARDRDPPQPCGEGVPRFHRRV